MLARLLSSVIDQLVPKVSSPHPDRAGPAHRAGHGHADHIAFDPNLFLVLFIAPLLYDEAKNLDKKALWENKRPVLSLAVGLVIASALIIGFAVNWLVPSIPLAAAFALGAALGPTDAVSVASLSKQVKIPARSRNILESESIINDASGIVSFQFAIAAAVTGTFSLVGATANFFFAFLGGVLVGVALGLTGNFIVRRVRSWGLENTTFHVLFEVFVPFIVYLVANALGTSGIIAVVAAGILNVVSPRAIGPSVSRMNIVSASVWRVLTFALNGIVFVLLGTQLPRAMQRTWENVTIDNDVSSATSWASPAHAGRPLPLGAYHGTRPSPAQRPDDVGRASLDGHHDLGRPEGNHHACRGVHYSFLHPAARAAAVPSMRRHRGHHAVGHVCRAADRAEERYRRRGLLRRGASQYRDTPIGHRRAGGTSNRREPRGHASGRPRLQRAHSPPEEQKRTARRVHGALAPESEPVGTRFHARPP
ncbi:MAG: cation:proton antiporter [Eggerthella lenta]